MNTLELPHWLMIAGAVLVALGLVGALVSRKKTDDVDLKPAADESTPKAQMPPLPKLLDSRAKNGA
ncbi:hypothetical protein ACVWZV_006214 [Bradyrhizobium sp. GM5.1]